MLTQHNYKQKGTRQAITEPVSKKKTQFNNATHKYVIRYIYNICTDIAQNI